MCPHCGSQGSQDNALIRLDAETTARHALRNILTIVNLSESTDDWRQTVGAVQSMARRGLGLSVPEDTPG